MELREFERSTSSDPGPKGANGTEGPEGPETPEGVEALEKPEGPEPSDTADRHMAQMLARLPRGGGPAGGSAGAGAEEPSAASVDTGADEGAMQAPSDTADRHMAQMLARLPRGGGPAARAAGTTADKKPCSGSDGAAKPFPATPVPPGNKQPLTASANPAAHDAPSAAPASPAAADIATTDRPADRPGAPDNAPNNPNNGPRNPPAKPDISSWDPPFQDLLEAAQKPAFQPGQSIGRYIVLEELGAGAMGAVLKAYDAQLDRAIAIKLLLHEGNEDDTARFQREAQALARLSHPNVIQVHDVGEIDGKTFVAMELVKGQTLTEWMEEPEQSRPWRECLKVYVQAGAGLAAAHEAGLIHRDFKPDNAIIDAKGQVRVLDFGMARRTRRTQGTTNAQPEHHDDRPADLAADDLALEASITNPGTIMGTPLYMPPEQWRGEEADPHSDQFSFCVALYEALYGVRPFAGKTIYELMGTIAEGRIVPLDAKGPVVPSHVRNAVLRGLSPDRDQRWPSMNELLAELRRLAAPPGRRYMARALAVGLAAMAGSAGFVGYLGVKDRCTGALAQMDGIWDDDRRQAVETAILGTELSYAPGTWMRVEQWLDDYADAWTDKHTEVCEATSVLGEQSEEAMRLRMRCLGKRRTSLRASVDQLTDANATVVENAVELVAGLPTLTLCDDLVRLEQQDQRLPPPEDPEVAAEVEVLRERLADIKAMQEAGRYAKALEEVEPLVQRAEALGYSPLFADAQLRRGALRSKNGQYVEAEQDLRRAHTQAVEHHYDEVALYTAQLLTFVVGNRIARHVEGQQWGQMEAVPLARRIGDPVELAVSLGNLGNVFYRQGDIENAKVHCQRSLVILEKTLGSDHLHVASSLNNLGNVLNSQGEYESARVYHQRALAIQEKALGSDHPNVALSLGSLGNVLKRQGDYKNARIHYERTLAIQEKALGSDHPDVALSLNNLGNVLRRQGAYEDARVYCERALAIREKSLGPDHPDVAVSLNSLGLVFYEQGDYEKVRVRYERALAIFENSLGPDHPYVAASLGNLGALLESQGKLETAQVHHQRALAIKEKALGSDHPDVAMSLMNLGLVLISQGDYDNARLHHQRALEIQERVLGAEHPDVARSLNNLGNVFRNQGGYDNARIHYQRALRIREKTLGAEHSEVASTLIGLAMVALETNDFASVRTHAKRAVSIREAAKVAPELLGEARFVLAQALWSKRGERDRARALIEQAREALAAAQGSGLSDVDLDDIEIWLATHRVE